MTKKELNKYRKKFKTIYKEKVLPSKTTTINTEESYKDTQKILKDYAVYRYRANEYVLGGKGCGKEE